MNHIVVSGLQQEDTVEGRKERIKDAIIDAVAGALKEHQSYFGRTPLSFDFRSDPKLKSGPMPIVVEAKLLCNTSAIKPIEAAALKNKVAMYIYQDVSRVISMWRGAKIRVGVLFWAFGEGYYT